MKKEIDRVREIVLFGEGSVPSIFYVDEPCDELEETVEIEVPQDILEACK